jgi:hypothetical protein
VAICKNNSFFSHLCLDFEAYWASVTWFLYIETDLAYRAGGPATQPHEDKWVLNHKRGKAGLTWKDGSVDLLEKR